MFKYYFFRVLFHDRTFLTRVIEFDHIVIYINNFPQINY